MMIVIMLPSTRISMMIVMVITILVATCCIPSTATIIDLSKDLPEDTAAMKFSEGAKAMEQAATAEPNIRAAIVMEKGKIVSSYYREDVNPSDSSPVFSATKSWMGLLIGLLVDDGLLSVHQTLGEIFTEDEAWTDVTDGIEDFRKNVTIKEMLTMTSGLTTALVPALMSIYLGTNVGGSSLSDSLAYPDIGEKGEFAYLSISNILSYVILKLSGKTPGELLAERVMPHLGIQVDDYAWTKNSDGLENAFVGMEVTPKMMVKFGQLYMQKGLAGPYEEQRVVSQAWVENSFTRHAYAAFSLERLAEIPPIFGTTETDVYYGYLFWGHPSKPNVFCSSGLIGNDMCIDPDNKRVVLQQTDFHFGMSDISGVINGIPMKLVHIGLNETLSFSAPNPNIEDSASHAHEVIGEEMEFPKSAVNALKSEELSNSGVMHVSFGYHLCLWFIFSAELLFTTIMFMI